LVLTLDTPEDGSGWVAIMSTVTAIRSVADVRKAWRSDLGSRAL
jgi:hypothetical protein